MKKARLQLPKDLSARKCWIGCYGGHFDIVIVFSKEPTAGPLGHWDEGEFSSTRNKDIIAGVFCCETFNAYFGTNIQPEETSCRSVEEYELTAWWDKYDTIIGLETDAD